MSNIVLFRLELQPIVFNPVTALFIIEKVVKRRTLNKQKQALVKYRGYRDLYWIPAHDIENLLPNMSLHH